MNPYFALLNSLFVPFAPHFAGWLFFFRGSKAIEAKIEKPSEIWKTFSKPGFVSKSSTSGGAGVTRVSDARERSGGPESDSLNRRRLTALLSALVFAY